jgi:hypothetical protein
VSWLSTRGRAFPFSAPAIALADLGRRGRDHPDVVVGHAARWKAVLDLAEWLDANATLWLSTQN